MALRFSLLLLVSVIFLYVVAVQSKSGMQSFILFLICSVIGFIFWILFTSSGRAYARKVDKDISESSSYSKNDLFVEKMETEQKERDLRTQEQLRKRELSEQRLRTERANNNLESKPEVITEKENQTRRVSPQYIESVFNKQLNPKNITVKVVLRDSVLQIMYQSEKSLSQIAIVDGTKKLLTLINPSDINKVKIYFKQSGDDFPKWDDEFELRQTTLPTKETPQSPVVHQPQPQLSRSVNYETQIRCPKCGSTQIMANKKGFDVGKAIVGSLVTPLVVGAVAGLWGSNDIRLNCLNCGHRWEPKKTN
jgi:hypothetical protein